MPKTALDWTRASMGSSPAAVVNGLPASSTSEVLTPAYLQNNTELCMYHRRQSLAQDPATGCSGARGRVKRPLELECPPVQTSQRRRVPNPHHREQSECLGRRR